MLGTSKLASTASQAMKRTLMKETPQRSWGGRSSAGSESHGPLRRRNSHVAHRSLGRMHIARVFRASHNIVDTPLGWCELCAPLAPLYPSIQAGTPADALVFA